MSILPGIVFHGAGNMYAGNWTTGLGLFIVGTAGAAAAVYEVGQDRTALQNDFSNSGSGVSIPDDLSPLVGNLGIILVGTVAFFWTGWDDLAGCGMAVDRYNKQLDEDKGTVSMLPANGGGALLTYNKSF